MQHLYCYMYMIFRTYLFVINAYIYLKCTEKTTLKCSKEYVLNFVSTVE